MGSGTTGERAGVDPSRIEQVADQPAHAVGLLVDDAEELARLRRAEALWGAQNCRRRPLDGGERRTQLVADHPQELRPHPVDRLERGEILHGDHHRFDRAVLGMDGSRVDQRADAAPVGGREHDLLGAHRLGALQPLGQREAVECDLAPVGEAAGDRLDHLLDRASGYAQHVEEASGLAVEHHRLAAVRIEHHDADRRGLDQSLEVGPGTLLGAVGAGVDDGRRRLAGEQQENLFVFLCEVDPALLVAQKEAAHLGTEMAHWRGQAHARMHEIPGYAERAHEGGEVRDPARPRQVAHVLEERHSFGPLLEPAVLVLGQAGGHEVLRRSSLIDGDHGGEACASERPGAVDHLAQDGFQVEARADAKQRLAERRQARLVGRRVCGRRVVWAGHGLVFTLVSRPARSGTGDGRAIIRQIFVCDI